MRYRTLAMGSETVCLALRAALSRYFLPLDFPSVFRFLGQHTFTLFIVPRLDPQGNRTHMIRAAIPTGPGIPRANVAELGSALSTAANLILHH